MTRIALIAAAAVTASWSMAAQTEDLPKRRVGLWETTMTRGDGSVQQPPIKQCIDDKTDMLAMGALGPDSPCKPPRVVKTPQGYEAETACSFGQMTTTAKSLISGDFSSKVTMRVNTTMVPAPGQQPQTTVVTVETRFSAPARQISDRATSSCRTARSSGHLEPGNSSVTSSDARPLGAVSIPPDAGDGGSTVGPGAQNSPRTGRQ